MRTKRYHYVTLNVQVVIKVPACDADEAGDKACREVEDMLQSCESADAEVMETERGEEVDDRG